MIDPFAERFLQASVKLREARLHFEAGAWWDALRCAGQAELALREVRAGERVCAGFAELRTWLRRREARAHGQLVELQRMCSREAGRLEAEHCGRAAVALGVSLAGRVAVFLGASCASAPGRLDNGRVR